MIVTIDNKHPPPYIYLDMGYLINTPPKTNIVEPEVYDCDSEEFVRSGAKVCPIQSGQELEIYDGKCYALHEKCWDVFKTVAMRVFGIQRDGVEINERYLEILVGVLDGGKVLDEGGGGYRLGFAHGFGDDVEIERYWRRLKVYGDGEAAGGMRSLEVHKKFEQRPFGGFVNVGKPELVVGGGGVDTDSTNKGLENKIDAVGALKGELGRNGMDYVGEAVREDGYYVPAIDGLPVEILWRVLEFLGGDGVIKFGMVEGGGEGGKIKRRVRVPEGVWKREFRVRGEVGWADEEGYWAGREDMSWFERFLNVRLRIGMDEKGVGSLVNLKRVFRVCEGVLDVIVDVDKGRVEGEEGEDLLDKRGFKVVVLPKGRGEVDKYLKLEGLKAKGVMVSYTGSGKMRFVSGMRFLPGGEGIGIVNLEDEVYCELFSKVPGGVMVLKVCFGEFGIKSITTVVVDGGEGDLEVGTGEKGVSEVKFIAGPDGVDIGGVSVSIDTYKITAFGIDCDAFIL
ncbi:hypothetical protein AOL_s00080g25 [Orbilia oligospora ATCC 24927]|uniref:Uncharacterized protein n=1 Tax=Arthrobotrys oligospora (strain ATCC 24927 / CBS 115.81 / DSM 1491) TaxID=756982 RepID=G1XDZ0_ARTOA|nr:hypothetical protein AOL_s00080g25 [Orbilia oligospora ATCC 24927]EGX48396.1 hypothetical protein AOL_s00080g25 [Orbilia oligospora ATCC 24927]